VTGRKHTYMPLLFGLASGGVYITTPVTKKASSRLRA